MKPNDFTSRIRGQQEDMGRRKADEDRQRESVGAVRQSGEQVTKAIRDQQDALLKNEPRVEIKNEDLAKSSDLSSVAAAINQMNLTTFVANSGSWSNIVTRLASLSDLMTEVVDNLDRNGADKIEQTFTDAVAKLQEVVGSIQDVKVQSDQDVAQALERMSQQIATLDLSPTISVPEPVVTISEREIDLSPLTELLSAVRDGVKNLDKEQDSSPITEGLSAVEDAIRDLIAKPIPVPEMPLPFKNDSNQGVQARVNDSGDVISAGTLVKEDFDYIGVAYPDATTETYTFKTGGSGGTTVATVTVVYTDSTKASLSTVTKT